MPFRPGTYGQSGTYSGAQTDARGHVRTVAGWSAAAWTFATYLSNEHDNVCNACRDDVASLTVSIGKSGRRALQMADDSTSDSLFVKARKSNDAFADLYTSYHAAVLRYFERRTPTADVAIDLAADTFGALFANIAEFHGTTEDQGRAWMWTIARNTLYSWYRRRSVEHRYYERVGIEPPVPGTDDYERVEELADCEEARLTMQRAFEMLSPTDRTALTLYVIDELSYGQIAAKLGVSVAAARIRAWRARCNLREIVNSVEVTDARAYPHPLAPATYAPTPPDSRR